jgi:hypothetical protein
MHLVSVSESIADTQRLQQNSKAWRFGTRVQIVLISGPTNMYRDVCQNDFEKKYGWHVKLLNRPKYCALNSFGPREDAVRVCT